CLVKVGERNNLRDDGIVPDSSLVEFGLVFLCQLFLLLIMVEDHRAILGAEIVALLVWRGRIVRLPKNFQQVCIADLGRIILNLNHWGVPGITATNLPVGRIFDVATGVARFDAHYAYETLKHSFSTPETSGSKRCSFHRRFSQQ